MMTADQVRNKLLRACEASGGLKEWCRANGLKTAPVYQFLGGGNPPRRVVAALGLIPVTLYTSAKLADNILRKGN